MELGSGAWTEVVANNNKKGERGKVKIIRPQGKKIK